MRQQATFTKDEKTKFNHVALDWWDTEGSLRTLHDINPVRLEYIAQYATLKDVQVLDVGCGGGIIAEGLAKRQAHVTGIDIAENAIQIARQHAEQQGLKIDYQHGQLADLANTHRERFAVVTCLEMLEHVDQPATIVEQCAALVAPGGKLFFSTLNRTLATKFLAIFAAEKVLKLIPENTHDYRKCIQPYELVEYCESSGLVVHDIRGMRYHPLSRLAYLSEDLSMNYLLCATKPSM